MTSSIRFILATTLIALALSVPSLPLEAKKGGGGGGGGGGPAPVTIDVRRDLDFGDAAGDGSLSGTVTLNPITEIKTVSGGVIDFGGREHVAEFRINGDKNADVYVVLPASVTITTPGGTMTINSFTMDQGNPVNLGSKGRATIKVGATLNLSPGQSAGNYTGSFTISADY